MRKYAALVALALGACVAQPPFPPPPPPIPPSADVYVAQGTEPFWRLTIDSSRLVFTEANAPGAQIVEPAPRPIVGFAGEIYQTPRLNVNIVHARCSDGMSDRTYPDKVQVRVDGRAFEGCGGAPMAPAQVANSSWQVLSVNGRAAPPGDRFFVRFEASRINARFGCNSMGGGYSVNGEMLSVGPLAMTRMACPDMSFEDQAGRVLSAPVRMTFQPGDQLLLQSPAGSILLRRAY